MSEKLREAESDCVEFQPLSLKFAELVPLMR